MATSAVPVDAHGREGLPLKRSIVLLSALLVVGCDGEEGRRNDSSSHGRVSQGHDEHGDPPDGEEDDCCETNDDGLRVTMRWEAGRTDGSFIEIIDFHSRPPG